MKITYVVECHSHGGGTERVLAHKANYLVNHGYEVSIISTEPATTKPFFEFDEKIKFHHLEIPKQKNNQDVFAELLTQCLIDNPTDITISNGLNLAIYTCLAKDSSLKLLEYHFTKYKRKSFLANWDRFSIGRLASSIYMRKLVTLIKKYDRFVVLTDEDRNLWRECVGNIDVIPNPLTIEATAFSQAEFKRVIAVGRYTTQKGFDRLIKNWKTLALIHPDWKLAIFGDGRHKRKLQKLIHDYNLENIVELLPPTKDIIKEFIDSSIFVMTSRYEGQPLVLLEAMTTGLPAVVYAFRCGARESIINGVDGFIVEEGDTKTFVEKVNLLMDDVELRKSMGEKARVNIQRFSEANIMPKWVSLFEGMVSKVRN